MPSRMESTACRAVGMMKGCLTKAWVARQLLLKAWVARKPLLKAWGSSGQSTVEYALVLFGFLALILAMGALGQFFQEGNLVAHALSSASHHVTLVSPGALRDVFAY